jgi:hypothetical protein
MSDAWEYEEPDSFDRESREDRKWRTASGTVINVANMTDAHLYNAYIKTGSEMLRDEMVVRLFANMLKGRRL